MAKIRNENYKIPSDAPQRYNEARFPLFLFIYLFFVESTIKINKSAECALAGIARRHIYNAAHFFRAL